MVQQLQILVVEKNPHLCSLLAWHLQQLGHDVQTANEVQQAKVLLQSLQIHLLVLDGDLSNQEGLKLCGWAHRQWNILILMLSSRSSDQDIIAGLQAGADDYLIKPMSMQVLCARVNVLSRRLFRTLPPTYLRYGSLQIDLVQRRVTISDQEVELTPQEFSLLFVLVQGNGSPLSRADLLQRAWPDAIDNPRTVDTHILSLRKKIEADPRHPTLIQTVRNVGYRFTGAVEEGLVGTEIASTLSPASNGHMLHRTNGDSERKTAHVKAHGSKAHSNGGARSLT